MLLDFLLLRNVDELFLMLRHFRIGKRKDSTDSSIILDETQIGQYKERERTEAIETLGIEYIQGYYFSKPLLGEEFLKFVATKMY